MKSRDSGISLKFFGSHRCPCICMSLHISQVKRFSLVSHHTFALCHLQIPLLVEIPAFLYGLCFLVTGMGYLLYCKLAWATAFQECPQTVAQGMISIALMPEEVSTSIQAGSQTGKPLYNVKAPLWPLTTQVT